MSPGASSNLRAGLFGARVCGRDADAVTEPTPDFIAAIAALNARVRQRAREARAAAGRAMLSGDPKQLVVVLQDTLSFLDALVGDLTESRAEAAAVYAANSEIRQTVDQVADDAE